MTNLEMTVEQSVQLLENNLNIQSLKLFEEIRLSGKRDKYKKSLFRKLSNFIEGYDTVEKVTGKMKDLTSPSLIPIIKGMLDITDKQLAILFNISERHLGRIKNTPTTSLNTDIQEKIVRILNIYKLAVDVFESNDAAREWLKSPQYGLNNEIPIKLLSSESRSRDIENLLYQIEYSLSV